MVTITFLESSCIDLTCTIILASTTKMYSWCQMCYISHPQKYAIFSALKDTCMTVGTNNIFSFDDPPVNFISSYHTDNCTCRFKSTICYGVSLVGDIQMRYVSSTNTKYLLCSNLVESLILLP